METGKRAPTFKSILAQFYDNGSSGEPVEPTRPRSSLRSMTPEQRRATQEAAHRALREGMTVFLSKDTVASFKQLLGAKTLNSTTMRKLLESIAVGQLTITKGQTTLGQITLRRAPSTVQEVSGTLYDAPTPPKLVNLSVDQLSAGKPFTLKQAARILNVTPGMLYSRCTTGKIHFERDRSRYLIPSSEVQRLQVIGLS